MLHKRCENSKQVETCDMIVSIVGDLIGERCFIGERKEGTTGGGQRIKVKTNGATLRALLESCNTNRRLERYRKYIYLSHVVL